MSVKLANKLGTQQDAGQRFRSVGQRSLHLGGNAYTPEPADENKFMRWAALAALAFHVLLFLVTFPELRAAPRELPSNQTVYVVQQLRFKPPAPAQRKKAPKPKTKKIPIPDPTPDDPEPILEEEDEIIELDLDLENIGDFLDIPPAPGGGPTGPMWVKGNIRPPKKVHAPQPRYTEEARQARIQGVVILQTVVDTEGKVTKVKIVKDLPHGLGESAVETVKQWQYEPATLEGEPVSVYLNITITFTVQ